MNNKVLSDFILNNNVTNELIDKYEDKLPKDLLEVWRNYGFGSFMNGYLKIINPDEFTELVNESYLREKDAIPIFSTGMGDLIIWSNNYVRLLNYRRGIVKTILFTFDFFFQNIKDEDFRIEDLDWMPYQEAVEKNGIPKYEECFGYVPLLGIGGSEKVENLQRVKLKEHIYLITQFMGPIE
ncbi:T6SS immunity protein Tdi1 domain-containing protein [Scopulibacillus cellulosilyticus]|uniref:T6SS immunity protein Tdi1 domain-containing protein n=1 Tax=Scopulibacillus cellulosilyticus TaxID=2665665 RepID=A0ABW2PWH2_9BACL